MILASRSFEIELMRQYPVILGIDEVGRGAIAGPVTVGGCVVDSKTGESPAGLADSKLVVEKHRLGLAEEVKTWAKAVVTASVPASEIDRIGIIRALRRAGMKVITDLAEQEIFPDAIILDGKHNWLAPSAELQLWDSPAEHWPDKPIPIFMRVKADRDCAVVAGASVVAKVCRDEYMRSLCDPGYQWARNKGYASKSHCEALGRLGVSDYHRKSWRLPLS